MLRFVICDGAVSAKHLAYCVQSKQAFNKCIPWLCKSRLILAITGWKDGENATFCTEIWINVLAVRNVATHNSTPEPLKKNPNAIVETIQQCDSVIIVSQYLTCIMKINEQREKTKLFWLQLKLLFSIKQGERAVLFFLCKKVRGLLQTALS